LGVLFLPFRVVYYCIAAPIYNHVFALLVDDFICKTVARKAQGNDYTGSLLADVTEGPLAGLCYVPLPARVYGSLLGQANEHASELVGEVRDTLGVAALQKAQFPVILQRLGKKLTWKELIHTSYFDCSAIRELLSLHIEQASKGGDGDAAKAPCPTEGNLVPTRYHLPHLALRWAGPDLPTWLVEAKGQFFKVLQRISNAAKAPDGEKPEADVGQAVRHQASPEEVDQAIEAEQATARMYPPDPGDGVSVPDGSLPVRTSAIATLVGEAESMLTRRVAPLMQWAVYLLIPFLPAALVYATSRLLLDEYSPEYQINALLKEAPVSEACLIGDVKSNFTDQLFDPTIRKPGAEASLFGDENLVAAIAWGEALVSDGRIEEALSAMREIKADTQRIRALAGLSLALTRVGMPDKAEKVWQEAIDTAKTIKSPPLMRFGFYTLVPFLAQAGRTSEAIEMTKELLTDESQFALCVIVRQLTESGRIEEARKIEGQLEDPYLKAAAQAWIALALARDNKATEAEAIWKTSISNAHEWGFGHPLCAELLARGGKTKEAVEMAEAIHDKKLRASSLNAVALALARKGRVRDALHLPLGTSESPVVSALVSAGKGEEALGEILQMKDRSFLTALALALASHHQSELALRAFEALAKDKDDDHRWKDHDLQWLDALLEAAPALGRSGKAVDVLAIVKRIVDRRPRYMGLKTRALAAAALAMTAGDRSTEEDEVWRQAIETAKKADDRGIFEGVFNNSEVFKSLLPLTRALSLAGKTNEALEAASQIVYPGDQDAAFAALAPALARQGNARKAIEVAGQIQNVPKRSATFAAVSEDLASLGAYRQARLAANYCTSPLDQLRAYTVIFERYAKAGR
jgi:tetratricopeptide (TPR) repeat protein